MNFLAHFYLSEQDESLIVGNFLGDFVKGNKYENYSPEISRGIQMHREIDSFTDQHPRHLQSKHRLGNKYGHYAGVAIDMFYDHLLAKQWAKYADVPLSEFSEYVYQVLEKHREVLTPSAQKVLTYMSKHDWLLSYQDIEGISRSLTGISQRAQFQSNLENAALDLKKDFVSFEEDFSYFFPDLRKHVEEFLNNR
ncbi:acyl carrier protein phosphodiesterase [Catalinimonas alkaloidigena]|uniref:acyl carrier protein phosphodiesterase n=1 Tax=Catalinimonas alkaloidigena TaxID=1075417 RepID=UPI002405DFF0|nr:ACP phosphodiesterase [Catalinimonas alkaloidigena]MDF9798683.1 acyl carrier protein phosphodiesterase [Catalinimonas alkaloidigena]